MGVWVVPNMVVLITQRCTTYNAVFFLKEQGHVTY